MDVTIRGAKQEDIPAAGVVQQAVLPPGHPYAYAQNIGVRNTMNFVAETNGTIIGFASVLLTKWDARGPFLWQRLAPYLAFIGVVPEHQGKGIGLRLLQIAVEEAATECVHEPMLFLEHDPENVNAHKVFERTGFRALTKDDIVQLVGIEPRGPVMALPLATVRTSK
jgi:GNAT superfamily N-acetyltransferase